MNPWRPTRVFFRQVGDQLRIPSLTFVLPPEGRVNTTTSMTETRPVFSIAPRLAGGAIQKSRSDHDTTALSAFA